MTDTAPFQRVLKLSEREYQVFCLTGQGFSVVTIAKKMGISKKSVWSYIERAAWQLGLDTSRGSRQYICLAARYVDRGLKRTPLLPEAVCRFKFIEPENFVSLKVA